MSRRYYFNKNISQALLTSFGPTILVLVGQGGTTELQGFQVKLHLTLGLA